MRGIVNYTPLYMIIKLMVSVSEPHVIDKVVTDIATLEGSLRNDSPISNPSILIESDLIAVGSLVRANYALIPDFGRYYYIKEATQIRNHLWKIDMVCDVLMSFAKSIKASIALIEQTTDVGPDRINEYMSSDSFVTSVKDKTDIIQFPEGLAETPYFILITAGGIVS